MRRLKIVKNDDALLEVPTHECDGVFTYSCLEICDLPVIEIKNFIEHMQLRVFEQSQSSQFLLSLDRCLPGEHKKDSVTLFAAALLLLQKFSSSKIILTTRIHFMHETQNPFSNHTSTEFNRFDPGTLILTHATQIFLSQAGFRISASRRQRILNREDIKMFYKEFLVMAQPLRQSKGA